MIAYLKGKILTKKTKYLILLTNDIGYQIFTNEKTLSKLKDGQEAELYIHHHVKEDAQELYGFLTLPELELFKNLISISGVGPRSAINVLAAASVEQVIQAIVAEDPALLKTVSGIGTKTAERIVVELKSKLGSLYKESNGLGMASAPQDMEVIEALLGLGYARREITEIIKKIPADLTTTENRLKEALKLLAR
jgi:Holliday junction DNA helicase RuvA